MVNGINPYFHRRDGQGVDLLMIVYIGSDVIVVLADESFTEDYPEHDFCSMDRYVLDDSFVVDSYMRIDWPGKMLTTCQQKVDIFSAS